MPSPLDLSALDAEALRGLIAQGRTILRDRRLIPEASLRRRDAPALTDEELRALRRAARRFGVRPATLADEVLALRAAPQVVILRSRDGHQARLTPLLRVHWARRGPGTALTGSGHLCLSLPGGIPGERTARQSASTSPSERTAPPP